MGLFSRRDKDGYDKKGYDKDGYNRAGYSRDGYDRFGYDIDWYDKDGFHKDGYNRDGYDRAGYNRDGYNKKGYNYHGFNFDRIHNVTGTKYDQKGYPDPTEKKEKFIQVETITRPDHDYEQEVLNTEWEISLESGEEALDEAAYEEYQNQLEVEKEDLDEENC
jgi:hypothetical protein